MRDTARGKLSDARDITSVANTLLSRLSKPADKSIISFYDRSNKRWNTYKQTEFIRKALKFSGTIKTDDSQYAIIATTSPEATLLAFYGSQFAGLTPAILPIRTAFDSSTAISTRLDDTLELLGKSSRIIVEQRDGKPTITPADHYSVNPIDPTRLTASRQAASLPDTKSAISHIQLTSGSTGASRGIAVSNGGVLANVNAIKQRGNITQYDVVVSWLPMYHDMGLIGHAMTSLLLGLDAYFMSPFDFLTDPLFWPETISNFKGTVSFSPTFGYDLITERADNKRISTFDLSSWKAAACGSEPIPANTAKNFIETFGGCGLIASSFLPCYGLAEATLAVTGISASETWNAIEVSSASLSRLEKIEIVGSQSKEPSTQVISLGEPVDGTTIEIRDENGSRVDVELQCGEIFVGGDSIAPGYIDTDGKIVAFNDKIPTGDIGFVHDGELFVVERLKNVVIRNGANYSTLSLERKLSSVANVTLDSVVVVDRDIINGSGLTGIIELNKNADPLPVEQNVLANLEEFEPPLESLVLVRKGAVARTTSGKKRHIEVREKLNNDSLPTIKELDLTTVVSNAKALRNEDTRTTLHDPGISIENVELEQTLLDLVASHVRSRGLDIPVVMGSRLQYDLDFDSLGLLELAMQAEEVFNVELRRENIASVRTVGDLMDAVLNALAGDDASGGGLRALLEKVRNELPEYYTTVTAVAPHRRAQINGRWMNDFATCNYLGLDENKRAIEAINALHTKWGMQRCWTRAVATPQPLIDLEKRLADLVDVPDVMVFPTVTLLHIGVLPLLAGTDGAIIIDTAAHKSMHEASSLARAKGATVTAFRHRNADDLEDKLRRTQHKARRIVVLDGVYSMTGQAVDLERFQQLAEKYDAILYVDDAHGFGVLGENPTEANPYGRKGNGVVKYSGLSYDRIIYVAGLSKAYSTMAAFISCPTPEYRQLFQAASTMIFVHSVPIATIAQAHAVLDEAERNGDKIRRKLHQMTQQLIAGCRDLGYTVSSTDFPIVNVILGEMQQALSALKILWDDKILLTPAIFPAAPLDRSGLRLTVTASNTSKQIDGVLLSLSRLHELHAGDEPTIIDLRFLADLIEA